MISRLEPRALLSIGDYVIDPTFHSHTGNDADSSFIVQPDGRIVVLKSEPWISVSRYLADGSDDPGFNGGEWFTSTTDDNWDASRLQTTRAGGVRWVEHAYQRFDNDPEPTIHQLTTGGIADESFGGDGVVSFADTVHDEVPHRIVDLVETTDGGIIALFDSDDNSAYAPHVLKLLSNGLPDPHFGTNGIAELAGVEEAFQIVEQADLKLLLLTALRDNSTLADGNRLIRLNANGSIDTTYAAAGYYSVPFDSDDVRTFDCLQRVADGSLLAAGNGVLARFDADGFLVHQFPTPSGIAYFSEYYFSSARGLPYPIFDRGDGSLIVSDNDETVLVGADGTIPTESFADGRLRFSNLVRHNGQLFATGAGSPVVRLGFEGLQLSGGTLTIPGTSGADQISIDVGRDFEDATTVSRVEADLGIGDDSLELNVKQGTAVSIDGGSGNDIMQFSGATGTVVGGDGNDSIDFSIQPNDYSAFVDGSNKDATINGGAGDDTIQISGFDYDVLTHPELETLIHVTTGDGNDSLSTVSNAALDADTGEGNDSITPAGGPTTVRAGGGDDTISSTQRGRLRLVDAGAGNDSITVQNQSTDFIEATTLLGGDGDDTILLERAGILDGGEGNDHLTANLDFASQTVIGGNGDDLIDAVPSLLSARTDLGTSINAGAGNDTVVLDNNRMMTIDAGNGDDQIHVSNNYYRVTILGGSGEDNIVVGRANRPNRRYGWKDISTDQLSIADGGDGNDQIQWAFATPASGTRIRGGAGNDAITLSRTDGLARAYGNGGDDTLVGESGRDHLYGNAGNDSIRGERGNDSLSGGAGDDTIDGGIGRDRITGDAGNDELQGNSGRDTIEAGDGDDLIKAADSFGDELHGGAGVDRAYRNLTLDLLSDIESILL